MDRPEHLPPPPIAPGSDEVAAADAARQLALQRPERQPALLTPEQGAPILGVPVSRLRDVSVRCIIGYVRIRGRVLFRRDDLEAWARPWDTWRGAAAEQDASRTGPGGSMAEAMERAIGMGWHRHPQGMFPLSPWAPPREGTAPPSQGW